MKRVQLSKWKVKVEDNPNHFIPIPVLEDRNLSRSDGVVPPPPVLIRPVAKRCKLKTKQSVTSDASTTSEGPSYKKTKRELPR